MIKSKHDCGLLFSLGFHEDLVKWNHNREQQLISILGGQNQVFNKCSAHPAGSPK